jgi:hypothetical protein
VSAGPMPGAHPPPFEGHLRTPKEGSKGAAATENPITRDSRCSREESSGGVRARGRE